MQRLVKEADVVKKAHQPLTPPVDGLDGLIGPRGFLLVLPTNLQ
jgi:hypothetical protein